MSLQKVKMKFPKTYEYQGMTYSEGEIYEIEGSDKVLRWINRGCEIVEGDLETVKQEAVEEIARLEEEVKKKHREKKAAQKRKRMGLPELEAPAEEVVAPAPVEEVVVVPPPVVEEVVAPAPVVEAPVVEEEIVIPAPVVEEVVEEVVAPAPEEDDGL